MATDTKVAMVDKTKPLPTKTEQPSDEMNEAPPSVSYFSLFRRADKIDILCMIAGTVGAIANGLGMPIFSIIFGEVLNSLGLNLGNTDALKDEVNDNVFNFLYLGAGCFVAAYMQVTFWTYTSVRQSSKIRAEYLRRVLHQEIAYFDTTATSGRLLQGLNEDCITIQTAMGEKLAMFLFTMSTAIGGIIIAFTKGWDMTLVILSLLPLLVAMGWAISTVIGRLTSAMNKAYGEANSLAQQALSQIRTVQAFNGDERTMQDYENSLNDPLKVGIRQGFLSGATIGFTNLVAFCGYGLAMWYGAQRIADGDETGGDVMNVLFAALIGGFALGQAVPNLQYFQQGRASAARVFCIMDRQSKMDLDGQESELKDIEGLVQFQDVGFRYPTAPDKVVLTEFTLTVPSGQTTALVGESGSGKSTVIGLVERFYDVSDGAVLLDGVDIRTLKLSWLRKQLALVSQEPTLFATTIRQNILFGKPDATEEEVEQAAKFANAHRFISGLPKGYDTHVGEKGVQMSGGQKQRIAIARAILKDPRVLLLDEATSALDAESEFVVQEALNRLMVGRTTIVVAHRLSTVVNAAQIAVVKKGAVVEVGTHNQLLSQNGAYSALIQMQQSGPATTTSPLALPSTQEATAAAAAGAVAFGSQVIDPAGPFNINPRALQATMTLKSDSPSAFDVESGEYPSQGQPVSGAKGGHGAPLSHKTGETDAGRAMVTAPSFKRYFTMRKRPAVAWGTVAEPVMDKIINKVENNQKAAQDKGTDKDKDKKGVSEKEGGLAVVVPMKRLAALNRKELPAIAGGLLGSCAMGMLMPTFSIAFSSLINVFYLTDPTEIEDGAQKWALVFMGIGFGSLFASIIQSFCFNYMGQHLAQRVRLMMMSSMLRQEIAWYDQEENSSGVLTSKLSTDALAVKGQFGDTMGLIVQNMVTLVAGYVIAGINSWKMMLVVTAFVPLIGIAGYIQTKIILNVSLKETDTFADANQVASEAFMSIKTIAAFGMENQVAVLYDQTLQAPIRHSRTRANVAGIGFGFSQFVLFSAYAVAFWYAGVLITNDESSFEDVLKAFFAIFLAAFGASQAQLHFPDVAKGKAATQRAFGIIDRQPKIDSSSKEGLQPASCVGEIQLVDVYFAYPLRPEAQIFKNFNLLVPAGKSVALVGESGSGKSTIISLVERFYDPDQGAVKLDGHDIRDLNLRWLRDQLALVSQEPVLFNMTVADNIRYGKQHASLEAVMEAAKAANAHTFIEALPQGYHTPLGEGSIQLSGGQKQRIAIARAVIKNPRVLLLDEATSALDAESERIVQDALDSLMVDRTTIVVAHRLSTVRHAHAIAVIHQGHIVEQGKHGELVELKGSYARLVQHQIMERR